MRDAARRLHPLRIMAEEMMAAGEGPSAVAVRLGLCAATVRHWRRELVARGELRPLPLGWNRHPLREQAEAMLRERQFDARAVAEALGLQYGTVRHWRWEMGW